MSTELIREAREALAGYQVWRDSLHGGTTANEDAMASALRALADALESTVAERDEARRDARWEYGAGYEADNGVEMHWFSMGAGAFTVREAAEREVERFADSQVRLVRRRNPGPWEPVESDPTILTEGNTP